MSAAVQRVPDVPYRPTMPVVVRRAAAEFGDDDYVVLPDRRITFREVERASRRLAKQLLAGGVGKGTRVGLHLPTGPEWAVAFIAVTRIGALAMPFSTLYRPAELQRALRIGDVATLITVATMLGKDHESLLEEAIPGLASSGSGSLRIPQLPFLRSVLVLGGSSRAWAVVTELATDADAAAAAVDGIDDDLFTEIEAEVSPADPMVVVFTSGTTADPKAVVHPQGAVLRKTAPMVGHGLDTTFPGRVLSISPFFWVGGVQQVTGALQSGAAILTLERLEGESALALAKREGATSLNGNAMRLKALFGATDAETTGIDTLRPLPRRPWEGPHSSTGEPPTPFGMTETFGPWSGIPEFDVRVVDPDTGSDLPPGEIGEYWVRGYGLMTGLYKREREDTFTPDGYYRTGDLGYAEHGQVYFRSRLDDMIKTKAANVAPAEVEAASAAAPEVRLAIVVGLPHSEWGQEVAAAVVAHEGHEIDVDDLRLRLRREISPYKVPTFVAVMRENDLPYLSSSKIDRRGLMQLLERRRDESKSAALSGARTDEQDRPKEAD